MTFVVVTYGAVVKQYAKNNTDLDAERSARLTMARVTDEMRQAMQDGRKNPDPSSPVTEDCDLVAPTPPSSGVAAASPTPASQITCSEAVSIPVDAGNPRAWLPSLLDYQTFTIQWNANKTITETTTDLYGPGGSSTTVLGQNVSSFSILPESRGVYRITLVTQTQQRADIPQIYNGIAQGYQLNSQVYISYFKP